MFEEIPDKEKEKVNVGKVYYTIHLEDGSTISDTHIGFISQFDKTYFYSARKALKMKIKNIIDVIEIGDTFYFANNVAKVTIDKEEDYWA